MKDKKSQVVWTKLKQTVKQKAATLKQESAFESLQEVKQPC